jgi:hypothetical protein
VGRALWKSFYDRSHLTHKPEDVHTRIFSTAHPSMGFRGSCCRCGSDIGRLGSRTINCLAALGSWRRLVWATSASRSSQGPEGFIQVANRKEVRCEEFISFSLIRKYFPGYMGK